MVGVLTVVCMHNPTLTGTRDRSIWLVSMGESHHLDTRHPHTKLWASKVLYTDRWLFFSLAYFHFHISFPYFSFRISAFSTCPSMTFILCRMLRKIYWTWSSYTKTIDDTCTITYTHFRCEVTQSNTKSNSQWIIAIHVTQACIKFADSHQHHLVILWLRIDKW